MFTALTSFASSALMYVVITFVMQYVISGMMSCGILIAQSIITQTITKLFAYDSRGYGFLYNVFSLITPDSWSNYVGSLASLISHLAWAIFVVLFIIAIIRSLFSGISNNQYESAIQVLINTIIGILLMMFFFGSISGTSNSFNLGPYYFGGSSGICRSITDALTTVMDALNVSDLLDAYTGIDISAWNFTTWFTGVDTGGLPMGIASYFVQLVMACSILSCSVSAAISFVERIISFGVYMFVGPLCIAMYPLKEGRATAKKWIIGLIPYFFGIILSLFFWMTFVSCLKNVQAATAAETIVNIVIAIVFLTLSKNIEELFHMLGFSTMNAGDAARNALVGAALAKSAFNNMQGLGKKIGNKWREGEKLQGARDAKMRQAIKEGKTFEGFKEDDPNYKYLSNKEKLYDAHAFGKLQKDEADKQSKLDARNAKIADGIKAGQSIDTLAKQANMSPDAFKKQFIEPKRAEAFAQLSKGVSPESVASITGLPKQEIQDMQNLRSEYSKLKNNAEKVPDKNGNLVGKHVRNNAEIKEALAEKGFDVSDEDMERLATANNEAILNAGKMGHEQWCSATGLGMDEYKDALNARNEVSARLATENNPYNVAEASNLDYSTVKHIQDDNLNTFSGSVMKAGNMNQEEFTNITGLSGSDYQKALDTNNAIKQCIADSPNGYNVQGVATEYGVTSDTVTAIQRQVDKAQSDDMKALSRNVLNIGNMSQEEFENTTGLSSNDYQKTKDVRDNIEQFIADNSNGFNAETAAIEFGVTPGTFKQVQTQMDKTYRKEAKDNAYLADSILYGGSKNSKDSGNAYTIVNPEKWKADYNRSQEDFDRAVKIQTKQATAVYETDGYVNYERIAAEIGTTKGSVQRTEQMLNVLENKIWNLPDKNSHGMSSETLHELSAQYPQAKGILNRMAIRDAEIQYDINRDSSPENVSSYTAKYPQIAKKIEAYAAKTRENQEKTQNIYIDAETAVEMEQLDEDLENFFGGK